jgi:hypothetical protein
MESEVKGQRASFKFLTNYIFYRGINNNYWIMCLTFNETSVSQRFLYIDFFICAPLDVDHAVRSLKGWSARVSRKVKFDEKVYRSLSFQKSCWIWTLLKVIHSFNILLCMPPLLTMCSQTHSSINFCKILFLLYCVPVVPGILLARYTAAVTPALPIRSRDRNPPPPPPPHHQSNRK